MSRLPRVTTIAATPCSVTLMNWCGIGGGVHRVDGDLDVAVGAVLEADRHRESGGQVAMHLALGGARADRPPAHGIGDELRRDRVEELAAGRQTQGDHVQQQPPRQTQPLVDGEAAVEVGIVDEPLPADRRARLLEVDAHHDPQIVRQLARRVAASRRAYSSAASGSWIEQGPTTTIRRSSGPRRMRLTSWRVLLHHHRTRGGERQLLHQDRRRHQGANAGDAQIARHRRIRGTWV